MDAGGQAAVKGDAAVGFFREPLSVYLGVAGVGGVVAVIGVVPGQAAQEQEKHNEIFHKTPQAKAHN